MMVNKKRLIMILMMTTALFLTACGGSAESQITGVWKLDYDEDEPTFLEIGEEQIISRQPSNDEPMIASYIFTETQSDNFILEVINPEDGNKVFLLEGYLDGKNRIEVVNAPGETADLIRVKDMNKEIEEYEEKAEIAAAKQAEKDEAQRIEDEKQQKEEEKREEEQAKADEKARAEEERKENERKVADEEQEKEDLAENEQEDAEENKKSEDDTAAVTSKPSNGSVKDEYYQRAKGIYDKSNAEGKSITDAGGRIPPGFSGQYYTEWDDLLNEVWGVLEQTMPSDEYAFLLEDQLNWIAEKEHTFQNDYTHEVASSRQEAMDYLTYTTMERVQYLINNYL